MGTKLPDLVFGKVGWSDFRLLPMATFLGRTEPIARMTGSSFAAALMTGIVARLLSVHPIRDPLLLKALLRRIYGGEENWNSMVDSARKRARAATAAPLPVTAVICKIGTTGQDQSPCWGNLHPDNLRIAIGANNLIEDSTQKKVNMINSDTRGTTDSNKGKPPATEPTVEEIKADLKPVTQPVPGQ